MGSQQYGAIIEQVLSTASSAGTLTLTNVSPQNHRITGVLAHSVQLPDATTFSRNGRVFSINNQSTGTVTVKYNDTTTLTTIAPGSSKRFDLFSNASSNGDWGVSGGAGSSSGSGTGAKNYNPNPNANTDTSGFAAFNTTFSGGLPTTIAAGSTKLALNRQTTNPLEGAASFEMDVTTAAASTGHGIISDAMTIDDEDLAKILQFSMSYSFSVNPANVDASGTSTQTVELWVYNVGLASWYQPTGFRGINTKGVPGYVAAQIQSDSSDAANANQYRIALIIRNDPAGTFKMLFDSVIFGPQKTVFGVPQTDEDQYFPTLAGSTTVTGSFWQQRRGNMVRIRGRMALTGAAQAVDISFTAPPGMSPNVSGNGRGVGGGDSAGEYPMTGGKAEYGSNANATQIDGNIQWDSNTSRFYVRTADRWRTSGTSVPVVTYSSNDTVDFDFWYEVAGYSTNVQMSSDTDTRIVAARYKTAAGQSITNAANPQIDFGTKVYDTHAAVTTGASWKFTAPVSGKYGVKCLARFASASFTAGSSINLALYKNGSGYSYLDLKNIEVTASNNHSVQGTDEVDLVAGDYIDVRIEHGEGAARSLIASDFQVYVAIERLSGPSVVGGNESVNAKYTSTSVAVNPVTINFNTKVYDSHNAMTTGDGSGVCKFTAPISGKYKFYAVVDWVATAANYNVNDFVGLKTMLNGVANDRNRVRITVAGAPNYQMSVDATIYLNAGDTVSINNHSSTNPNINPSGVTTDNYICVERVGN